MSDYFDEDYPDEYYDDHECSRCDGEGVILVCPDDACRGAGQCIHGDGEIVCPECHGDGFI